MMRALPPKRGRVHKTLAHASQGGAFCCLCWRRSWCWLCSSWSAAASRSSCGASDCAPPAPVFFSLFHLLLYFFLNSLALLLFHPAAHSHMNWQNGHNDKSNGSCPEFCTSSYWLFGCDSGSGNESDRLKVRALQTYSYWKGLHRTMKGFWVFLFWICSQPTSISLL